MEGSSQYGNSIVKMKMYSRLSAKAEEVHKRTVQQESIIYNAAV